VTLSLYLGMDISMLNMIVIRQLIRSFACISSIASVMAPPT
jgi:hypothetical protein